MWGKCVVKKKSIVVYLFVWKTPCKSILIQVKKIRGSLKKKKKHRPKANSAILNIAEAGNSKEKGKSDFKRYVGKIE